MVVRTGADVAVFEQSAQVVMRNYLSTHHLYAARYAAEAAQERETKLASEQPTFDMRHRGHVLAAVMESAAFLEAAINELYQDAADRHGSYTSGLDERCLRLMSALWAATDGGYLELLHKYDLALQFAGSTPFKQDQNPYQATKALLQLRNYLVHYKPHEHRRRHPLLAWQDTSRKISTKRAHGKCQ